MTPEQIAALAALLGLTAEQITELTLEDLGEQLSTLFDEQAESADLADLQAIQDARLVVRDAIAAAETAEADRQAEIERMRAELEPTADGEAEAPAEDEGEAEVVEEAEAIVEEAEVVESPEAVAAAAVVRMRRRPVIHEPVETSEDESYVSLVAAVGDSRIGAGQPVPSLSDLGRMFVDRAATGQTGKQIVASFRLAFPDDRKLLKGDHGATNATRIRNVASPQAVVAAGGNCAPVAIRYDFENISVDDRPVRDALARFNADRGGINVPTSPVLTDPDAGVGVVTEAQDAGGATKNCAVVTCPDYSEIDVSAVYKCVEIGNFSKRFFPELFADWWALAGALHARKAEGQLLDGIGAASTQVTDGQNLGAALDLLESYVRAAAKERSTHRMARNAPVQLFLPEWVNDLMRADLFRQGAAPVDRLMSDSAYVDRLFTAQNINVTWYKDTETGEGQIYAEQGAGALAGWNLAPVSYMHPVGGFLFLDGGSLDFGTDIRDTTMNEANTVRAFMETFENVTRLSQWALEFTHSLCVNGATAAAVELTCPVNS